MQLGYGLITCQRYPDDPRTWADRYREALELARLCEEVGLDSVWTSEHHFLDDGYMPSLAVTSAAIAAVTSWIEVGTAVVLAPLHHPLRLAEDAATVDCIAGGRFVLGLGSGWRAEEFERLGVPRDGAGRRVSETVRILRGAWGPEPFEHHGKLFDVPRVNVTPKPTHPIPIFIGGGAEPALRRAARIGDGFIASGTSATIEVLRSQVAVIRQGLAAAGRDPSGFRCWVHFPVWVSTDPEAEAKVAVRLWRFVRWKYADMSAAVARSSSPLTGPPPMDEATRATMASQLILGTPEQVAARIAEFGEVLGEGGQFIARSYFPGLDTERAGERIRLLGEVKKLLA